MISYYLLKVLHRSELLPEVDVEEDEKEELIEMDEDEWGDYGDWDDDDPEDEEWHDKEEEIDWDDEEYEDFALVFCHCVIRGIRNNKRNCKKSRCQQIYSQLECVLQR